MATLLSIVQDFCKRGALGTPTTVIGSGDSQITQIQGLLEEECNDLAARHPWQGITFEASLTSLALEDQGAMSAIATNGFRSIRNNTIWDRTDRLPVLGPMSGSNWQFMKAMVALGPRYRFRIRGDHLLVNPPPSAGHDWRFEYLSKNFATDTGGTIYKARFTVDTDIVLLPDDLCLQGLRWRWKKEKGFDYAEDFRTYEAQVMDAMGRDGGKPPLYMDCGQRGPSPGIFIAPWNTVT